MKTHVLAIALQSIFVVLFNLVFFLSVEVYSTTRWICYAAIHISYLFMLMASNSIPKNKSGVVYGYPKIAVATAYFIVTLFFGVLFIAINNDSTLIPSLVLALISGGFLVFYAIMMLSEEHSINNEKRDTNNLYFMRDMSIQLQSAMESAVSPVKKKEVERAYDAIRNAQGLSSSMVKDIEERIRDTAGKLEAAVKDDEALHIIQEITKNLICEIKRRDDSLKMNRLHQ